MYEDTCISAHCNTHSYIYIYKLCQSWYYYIGLPVNTHHYISISIKYANKICISYINHLRSNSVSQSITLQQKFYY